MSRLACFFIDTEWAKHNLTVETSEILIIIFHKYFIYMYMGYIFISRTHSRGSAISLHHWGLHVESFLCWVVPVQEWSCVCVPGDSLLGHPHEDSHLHGNHCYHCTPLNVSVQY